MKESIAISDTLLHLRILKVFTSCYWGKEVLDKVILVLDFFSQKFCMTMQLQTVMISAPLPPPPPHPPRPAYLSEHNN